MKQPFKKGDDEATMFSDFCIFVQEYYIPEENDDYWTKLVDAMHKLDAKHKSPLLRKLLFAYLDYIEDKYRDMKRSE